MLQWVKSQVNLQMPVKKRKIYPAYNLQHTKKDGISNGIQRYNCKVRFRSKRRPLKL